MKRIGIVYNQNEKVTNTNIISKYNVALGYSFITPLEICLLSKDGLQLEFTRPKCNTDAIILGSIVEYDDEIKTIEAISGRDLTDEEIKQIRIISSLLKERSMKIRKGDILNKISSFEEFNIDILLGIIRANLEAYMCSRILKETSESSGRMR